MNGAHEDTRRAGRWMLAGYLLLLFGLGFSALGRYNANWDETLGDFFFGERYLSYLTSFDDHFLSFEEDPYPEDRRPDLRRSPFRSRPWEYYPFANTLAAASSRLLSHHLGLLDPFDGFHAVNLFFAGALLIALFSFCRRHFGLPAATVAVGLLFGSPRLVAHMMANIKDFPVMAMFGVTALVFFRALETGSRRGLGVMGILLGLTLATKANALFFPLIPALTLILGGVPEAWRGRARQLWIGLPVAGLASLGVTFAAWPYLWSSPWEKIRLHLEFLLSRKAATNELSVASPWEALAFTTPPMFLLATGLGLVLSILYFTRADQERRRPILFLWIWIGAVLSRFLIPQAVNYDGVRHFMEVFPAFAALAGFGAGRLGELLSAGRLRGRRRWIQAMTALCLIAPGAWQVARSHPFQLAYWNSLTGGLAGAREQGRAQASDYWGLSYRLGMEWLNANAEPGSYLAVPIVEHAARLVAPERLRPDLPILPLTTPFSPHIEGSRLRRTAELALRRPVYVMFVPRRDWTNTLMADCLRRLRPVAEWRLDDAPVLLIYRYRPPSAVDDPQHQQAPEQHVDHKGQVAQ